MHHSSFALIIVLIIIITTKISNAQTLRQAAQRTGVYVGAIRNYGSSQKDQMYNKVVDSEYDLITAENECKWGAIRPSQNQFDFSSCDYIQEKAQNSSSAFRGHNLCWGQYNPGWLQSGSWTQDQLTEILQNHIDTVVKHYKGKALCWDVVNEAISDNPTSGDPLKPNLWYPKIPNYVDVAFVAARNADSSVKLFYNDYSAEGAGAKSDAVYNMVKSMKSRGIPIDGVGLQMHVSTNYCPTYDQISANIKRLGALGLEVHITEMDVSCPDPCDLNKQALIYGQVLRACLDNRNTCKSFQSWGFTDLYTWLGTDKHPLPFDQNYNRKPAYNSILSNFTKN